MNSTLLLDKHFPPPPEERHTYSPGSGFAVAPENIRGGGGVASEDISTRHRAILSLELQGATKQAIAQRLGLAYITIQKITTDPRYIKFRNEYLAALDDEFFAMKPLAFAALKGGLQSQDEDTALKASDQWFKAAGFGGYSKSPEPSTNLTAEDVVRQLLHVEADSVQININTTPEGRDGQR